MFDKKIFLHAKKKKIIIIIIIIVFLNNKLFLIKIKIIIIMIIIIIIIIIIVTPAMHGSSGLPSFTVLKKRDQRYCKQSIIQQSGGITSAKTLIVACLAFF